MDRKSRIGLAVALVVALAFRLWQIDLVQFWWEQGVYLEKAAELVEHGVIPLTNGLFFTVGARHPPLFTFLLAPGMLISTDPVWVCAYLAILDALAVIPVFLAARELTGFRGGLGAALLYGVSPAAVNFSRVLWSPTLVPLLSAIALWALVTFSRGGDGKRFGIAVFALGCAAELHPTAAALLVPLAAAG